MAEKSLEATMPERGGRDAKKGSVWSRSLEAGASFEAGSTAMSWSGYALHPAPVYRQIPVTIPVMCVSAMQPSVLVQ